MSGQEPGKPPRAGRKARTFATVVALLSFVPVLLFLAIINEPEETGVSMGELLLALLLPVLKFLAILAVPLAVGLVVWWVVKTRGSGPRRTDGHSMERVPLPENTPTAGRLSEPAEAPAAEQSPMPTGLVVLWRLLAAFAVVVLLAVVTFTGSLGWFADGDDRRAESGDAEGEPAGDGVAIEWQGIAFVYSGMFLLFLGPVYIIGYLVLLVVTVVQKQAARHVAYGRQQGGMLD